MKKFSLYRRIVRNSRFDLIDRWVAVHQAKTERATFNQMISERAE